MNHPLRPLCIPIATTVLFAGVCACSTAADRPAAATPSSTHAATRPSPDAASLATFAKEIGVTCETRQERTACIGGRPEVGDYADIDLHPDCGKDGWFGVITANPPVELRDRVSPMDTKTIATVARGQAVCIRAIGQVHGKPFYYFVSAIPQRRACVADATCNSSAPPAIHWTSPRRTASCRADTQSSLRNCASGWIQADDLSRLAARPQTL